MSHHENTPFPFPAKYLILRNVVFAFTALIASLSYGLEPLKESTEAYQKTMAERFLAKADKSHDGAIQAEEQTKDWQKLKRLDANGDGSVDVEELTNRTLKYVTSTGKQLRNVLYKRTDTQDLHLDFYFPDTDTSNSKPVVVYTHGGGWAAGSKHGAGNASFNVIHGRLLQKGFCVAAVQYRLTNKEAGTAMRDCVIDSQDAVRFLSAHSEELGIDPMKIYTFGDSAGGHLAQMLLLAPSDAIAGDPELAKYPYKTVAGVSWYGPCDFEDEQLFNHDDRKNFRDRFGPRIMGSESGPKGKTQRYREMSPVNYLTKDSPPLLMIQGDGDTTIPVKQAHRMQEALQEIKAPVEIMIVKHAGHNWRQADGRTPIQPSRGEIIESTVQFLVKHLR